MLCTPTDSPPSFCGRSGETPTQIRPETYAAYALYIWLSGIADACARHFAKVSALTSLAVGAAGQIAYHLMQAHGITVAPWPITTVVATLPVAILGMGATLAHLITRADPVGAHTQPPTSQPKAGGRNLTSETSPAPPAG